MSVASDWPQELWDPEESHLRSLNLAISRTNLPCATGVFPVKETDLVLFYGGDDEPCGAAK